jgi:hypothetical protein
MPVSAVEGENVRTGSQLAHATKSPDLVRKALEQSSCGHWKLSERAE